MQEKEDTLKKREQRSDEEEKKANPRGLVRLLPLRPLRPSLTEPFELLALPHSRVRPEIAQERALSVFVKEVGCFSSPGFAVLPHLREEEFRNEFPSCFMS